MTPAQILQVERDLHDLVAKVRAKRYAVEAVDRVHVGALHRAVAALDDLAQGIAWQEDGNRIPGSLYAEGAATGGARL